MGKFNVSWQLQVCDTRFVFIVNMIHCVFSDSALLSTNISNFRHTDAETFSCNEILVIGIMGTPSLEEGGEGESVFSLNQEVDRTKNKKSGAGTVQLLRASTLKILQGNHRLCILHHCYLID